MQSPAGDYPNRRVRALAGKQKKDEETAKRGIFVFVFTLPREAATCNKA
jgi:hypothetical protein